MSWSGKRSELRRAIADFAIALALFWSIALGNGVNIDRAHAVPLPEFMAQRLAEPAAAGRPLVGAPSLIISESPAAYAARQQSLVLASIAFAAIVACNLAFWRHLRRAYASPRRRVWRRG